MRKLAQFAASLALLATQVNVPQLHLGNVADADPAPAVSTVSYEVKVNTTSADAVVITAHRPDYDAEVLNPLHTAQAEAAAKAAQAQAAAAAARKKALAKATAVKAKAVVIPGSDVWARLRFCEAGGDYTRNSGNGYYGAYQYNLGSWGNYMGYARPDLAPPAIQDEKARITQAARGWSPWPACARKLGLM
jgi:hypothetical protein